MAEDLRAREQWQGAPHASNIRLCVSSRYGCRCAVGGRGHVARRACTCYQTPTEEFSLSLGLTWTLRSRVRAGGQGAQNRQNKQVERHIKLEARHEC